MKVKILGSSSKGNSYLLESFTGETLIIECGIAWKEILKGLYYDLKDVAGCLITHEHLDHSKEAKKVMESGIDLIASAGTLNALGIDHHRAVKIGIGETKAIGSYKVMAIKTKHDCAESVGFLIHHKEMSLMLFATDTYYLENTFEGLNNVFIECNYAKDILYKNAELGIIDNNLKNRTIRSHFELENVKSFLKANDLSQVKNIVLLHLSDKNSDEARFKKEIEELTGKNVVIADKGVEIDLNLFPF